MWDQPNRRMGGRSDRHDLIVVAVDDQGGLVKLLQVVGEVRLRKRLDAVVGILVTGNHALQPEAVDHALTRRGAGSVEAEERTRGEVLIQLRPIGDGRGPQTLEHLHR